MDERRVVKANPPPTISTFFALQAFPGIAVAKRSAQPHDVAGPHVVQVGGDHPGAVDGKLDESLFHRRGGDTDGNLALTGNGELGKLPGPVGELLFIAIVQKNEFERLQTLVLGLDGDVIDADRIG